MSLFRRAAAAALSISLAACARGGTGSPRAAAEAFHAALARGDTAAVQAGAKLTPDGVDENLAPRLAADLVRRMAAREFDFRVIDARADAGVAVAVIDECVKRGATAFDIDPLWMVESGAGWTVLMSVSVPTDSAALSSPDHRAQAARLAAWFEQRKQALEADHRLSRR
jgi:hypothetical protein